MGAEPCGRSWRAARRAISSPGARSARRRSGSAGASPTSRTPRSGWAPPRALPPQPRDGVGRGPAPAVPQPRRRDRLRRPRRLPHRAARAARRGNPRARRSRRLRGAQPEPAAPLVARAPRGGEGRRGARAGRGDQPGGHRRAAPGGVLPRERTCAPRRRSAVVDGLDNVLVRRELAAACRELALPLVHGAIAGWYGQVAVQLPGGDLSRLLGPRARAARAWRRSSATRPSRRR